MLRDWQEFEREVRGMLIEGREAAAVLVLLALVGAGLAAVALRCGALGLT